MKDVFFFLFLLAVWVVSFGVAKQAILIHNEIRVDWIFRGVVYHSYMTLFGQIPSYIDGVNFNIDQCTVNGTDPNKQKCPESNKENHQPVFPQWLTVLLLCLYLLFTNILLLNLLIAMFKCHSDVPLPQQSEVFLQSSQIFLFNYRPFRSFHKSLNFPLL
ncbi:hypothetical protein GDO81_022232 [Engystomops pustulosus]|uniref:Uncharacterized protein n=1 Tax=Engystomops pustulosus TaxID=76066 RepID=A0AAV6YSB4_ENGPU|nr:hypothetical protein GDO81_022232 [Engystomops pustulosus]